MKIPFLALIFQGIPESIAIIALAFVVARLPLEWKKIVIIGLITTFLSYLIRLLPVTFGIHTVLLIVVLFLFLISVGKGDLNKSLIASLLSVLALIVAETVCLTILMSIFDVTTEEFFTNTTTRIFMTLPQVFVLFTLAYIVRKVRKPVLK